MARPVNRSSHMRDLIQVLSLLRVEKLPSALAVLTGKVTRNSSEDEIANVNFLYDDIVHVP